MVATSHRFCYESKTQNERGRSVYNGVGACVMAGFGALWIYNGLTLAYAPRWAFAVALLATATLALGGVQSIRAAKQAGIALRPDRYVQRKFWIIFGAEGLGIIAVILVLQLLKADQLVVPAILAVVGIHFLPLAGLFKTRLYYATGAALIAWSAMTLVALPNEIRRDVATCLGAGLLIWISGMAILISSAGPNGRARP